MVDTYINWRQNKNIFPTTIPNKEQYYLDLTNIEHSFSGRLDGNICNTFIMEAEQQIINAIELFEKGYFDCAYYSLRSAIEISTTMVFFDDMPNEDSAKLLQDWKSSSDFPMQSKMLSQLSKQGSIFLDMKENMPNFFCDAKMLNADLNKYVHKQGERHFYVCRNYQNNQNTEKIEQFISEFEKHVIKCIGVVAVMRLAIDPFPILLMDNNILHRCFDSLTEPYSEEFVDKYIGSQIVEQYKKTNFYTCTYESFLNDEWKNDATFNVMKYMYIDTNRFEEIFAQLHLLYINDIISVLLVSSNIKVVKVYSNHGLGMYHTNRKTNRTKTTWCGKDFADFLDADLMTNQHYDEAYISVFFFNDEPYFVEHNELFSEIEITEMIKYVSTHLCKLNNCKKK